MRYAAATQAKRSHAGNATEGVVEAQHEAMARLGVAWLFKVPTPMRVIGKTSAGLVCCYVARSTVDFLGSMADGRAAFVEAKHLASRTLASGAFAAPSLSLSRVEPHQALALTRVSDAGGVAVLLLVVDQGRALFAVPWGAALDAGPTLRGAALERHRVKPNALYLPLPSL